MESTESHGITRNQWNHMESADSAVLESFGITWNHMESMESHGINGIIRNQRNHMESTESTESHEISWNPMESADSAVLESFGITWNHVESCGITWNQLESWNHGIIESAVSPLQIYHCHYV
jgi:hypothetical protein